MLWQLVGQRAVPLKTMDLKGDVSSSVTQSKFPKCFFPKTDPHFPSVLVRGNHTVSRTFPFMIKGTDLVGLP